MSKGLLDHENSLPPSALQRHLKEARAAALHDPSFCGRMDWLSATQIAEILDEVRRDVRTHEAIARDWLVSRRTIQRLASRAGIKRRPGRRPALNSKENSDG
jgi:hypothetical protein